MNKTLATLVALALVAGVSGCASGVKVASGAADDAARLFGTRAADVVELSGDDVSLLASRAGVQDDVIRSVAPELDRQPLWRRSLTGVGRAYDRVPSDVRSGLVATSCDILSGEISTVAELEDALYDQLAGATQDEVDQALEVLEDLVFDLQQAYASDDPDTKAAAVLTCFTFEEAVGVD